MTILRSGATKLYSGNWAKAFGGGTKKKTALAKTKKKNSKPAIKKAKFKKK